MFELLLPCALTDWSNLAGSVGSLVEAATNRINGGNHDDGSEALPAQTRLAMLLGMTRGGTGRVDASAFGPLLESLDANGDGKVDMADLPGNVQGLANQVLRGGCEAQGGRVGQLSPPPAVSSRKRTARDR